MADVIAVMCHAAATNGVTSYPSCSWPVRFFSLLTLLPSCRRIWRALAGAHYLFDGSVDLPISRYCRGGAVAATQWYRQHTSRPTARGRKTGTSSNTRTTIATVLPRVCWVGCTHRVEIIWVHWYPPSRRLDLDRCCSPVRYKYASSTRRLRLLHRPRTRISICSSGWNMRPSRRLYLRRRAGFIWLIASGWRHATRMMRRQASSWRCVVAATMPARTKARTSQRNASWWLGRHHEVLLRFKHRA